MDIKMKCGKISGYFNVSNPTAHFWYQRVTAIALIPLSVSLVILMSKALNSPYQETVDWLTSPINAIALAIWIVAVVYHAALGVQVVIEDYVSTLSIRHTVISITNLIFLFLGVAALAAMAFILFAR